MNRQLVEALRQGRGIIDGSAASAWLLKHAIRSGVLTRLFPGTYVDADLLGRLSAHGRYEFLCRAALRYTRGRGAVSHTSALSIWGVAQAPTAIHVTVDAAIRKRATAGIVLHHQRGFSEAPQHRRGGVVLTSAAEATVASWPILGAEQRIGSVIEVVKAGLASTEQIRQRLKSAPKLQDRGALAKLLGLIDGGCRSPLEVWGADHVFAGPGFRHLRRQVAVRVADRAYVLDLYAEEEEVNFELDGAAFHGSALQREHDLKRDAQLAAIGILVVRFSYARLMCEPDVVRREALAILAIRRRSTSREA